MQKYKVLHLTEISSVIFVASSYEGMVEFLNSRMQANKVNPHLHHTIHSS